MDGGIAELRSEIVQRRTEMGQPEMLPCSEHGRTHCYIQRDGRHIDPAQCTCGHSFSPQCPIDLHREAAERATEIPAKQPPVDAVSAGK